MEYGNNKFDVRIMTYTVDVGLTTSFAESVLFSCALKAGSQLVSHECPRVQLTIRLSRTPFCTGNRSVGVYKSRWVTSNSEILTVSWILRRLNWIFFLIKNKSLCVKTRTEHTLLVDFCGRLPPSWLGSTDNHIKKCDVMWHRTRDDLRVPALTQLILYHVQDLLWQVKMHLFLHDTHSLTLSYRYLTVFSPEGRLYQVGKS